MKTKSVVFKCLTENCNMCEYQHNKQYKKCSEAQKISSPSNLHKGDVITITVKGAKKHGNV
jgi:hypothetical protein